MSNETALRKKDVHQSAIRLLLILAGTVFCIETLVMLIIPLLPPMSEVSATLLDASLLSILLFPIFYFLVFRPLIKSICERKIAEDALRESERRFRNMADEAPALIWMTDTQNAGIWYNQQWLKHTGRVMKQERGFGWIEGIHPDDREHCAAFCQNAFDSRQRFEMEFRLRRADGSYGWIADVGRPRFDNNGEFLGFIGYCWDIDNRKAAEARLKLAANVFTFAREGIVISDANSNIIDVNDTFTRITGYSRKEVLGKNPRMFHSGRQSTAFYSEMWQTLSEKNHWNGEVWNRRKNGEVYAEMLTISAIKDAANITQNYVALFTDITSMKEHQQQLEHIAHYDPLTDLPNRVLLADRLQQAIAQCQRHSKQLAVLYLDLDGFKMVNDTYGHEVGDELLITVSQRMKEVLREGDTLARVGGDEFVAALVQLDQANDYLQILERLLQAASSPVTVKNTILHVSASIGVTLFPQEGADADTLLRQADQAMYQAKQSGKNRYQQFNLEQKVGE